MAFKFVIFATILAVANAGLLASPLQYSAPLAPLPQLAYNAPLKTYAAPIAPLAPIAKIATPVLTKTLVQEEYAPAQYNFGYDVQDTLTGDIKEQHEQRDGDIVTGRYALNDPDGYRRIVEYTSDPIHGFNAVVRREPLAATPIVAKVATPIATPVLTKYAAPLQAPLLTKTLATPISYSAPAPLAYHAPAPLAYAAPAPLAYPAPAPLAYPAPIAKLAYPAQPTYLH